MELKGHSRGAHRHRSQTRMLGAICVALLVASGLQVAILATTGPATVLLTKVVNRLLKFNLPGASSVAEPGIVWRFVAESGVLSFALLTAAFLIGHWLCHHGSNRPATSPESAPR